MPLGIEVRLLGPATLLVDGEAVPLPGARQRVALAAMALARGGVVSSEALADYLWGEDQPDRVRPALHTTITRLRKLVGSERVVSTGGGYALDVPDEAVDVRRFRALVADARRADDPGQEQRLLREARALWRGDPLDGVDSEQLRAEHLQPLTEEWFAATERLVDLRLARGELDDLVSELRALVSRHPLRESLWSRLMRALAATGRQADALEAYQEVRRLLLEELGLDPGPELGAAHAAVLAGEEEPPATGSTPSPSTTVPRQLPTDVASFVGREDQLRELDGLAAVWDRDPDRRAATVVLDAAGGMGKTALAVRWGHRRAHAFPHGQLYVNLRGFGPGSPVDPFAAAGSLLNALGATREQVPADPEARFAQLRTLLADRRLLLVLDNARDVEQVRPLLPGSSAFVLVTSRNQLRGLVSREGAHRITVPELSEEEAVGMLQRAADASVREVAELCARVPLALAVARERLARAPGGGAEDVLAELRDEQDRLDALSSGDDLTSDMRAVLSWSYQTLTDDEARLFRLLPLAPGPDISAPAAAALAGGSVPRTRRLLDRLVASHLLLEKAPGRFEMHDLVRVYAGELAAPDPGARRRVLGWYHHTALAARERAGTRTVLTAEEVPGVVPLTFADPTAALDWLDRERVNLLDVVDQAADAGLDTTAWHVSSALSVHALARAPWVQSMRHLELALACARRSGDREGEALMLGTIGDVHHFDLRFDESIEVSKQALAIWEELGDLRGQAGMLTNIGGTYEVAEQIDLAIEYCRRAVEVCQVLDDPGALALVLNNLAAAYNAAGRHDEAEDVATEALGFVEGDEIREADMLDEIGQAHAGRGRHDRAIREYRRALDRYRAAGHPFEVPTLHHLGRSQRETGDLPGARESWQRAARLASELGDPLAADIEEELASLGGRYSG